MIVITLLPSRTDVVRSHPRWPGSMFPPVAYSYHPAHDPVMRVVVSSNDVVKLSFLIALLADAGIHSVLLDNHTSVLEGSAIAIPRRLVVSADDFHRARRILQDAGEW